MEKTPIGLIIRELIKKKNLKIVDVAAKTGLSRQGVYDTMARRVSMTYEELDMWANVLEVDRQVIIDKMNGKSTEESYSNFKPDAYLMEFIKKIENEVNSTRQLFTEQLRKKDEQIEHLFALLGKPNGVSKLHGLSFPVMGGLLVHQLGKNAL